MSDLFCDRAGMELVRLGRDRLTFHELNTLAGLIGNVRDGCSTEVWNSQHIAAVLGKEDSTSAVRLGTVILAIQSRELNGMVDALMALPTKEVTDEG
jgi:hypothetical protein